MNDNWPGPDSRRRRCILWLLALCPLIPLADLLVVGRDSAGALLALQVLFTAAAACFLYLAFDMVAKLRYRGTGRNVPGIGLGLARMALSFLLFWFAFALALGAFDAASGARVPGVYLIYCAGMFGLLVAALLGGYLLGRWVRSRVGMPVDE